MVDSLVATVGVLSSVGFGIASAVTDDAQNETSYAATAGVLALTGVVALTSAVLGMVRVQSCRRATAAWEAIHGQPAPMPPKPTL